jgi:hypothetical protein
VTERKGETPLVSSERAAEELARPGDQPGRRSAWLIAGLCLFYVVVYAALYPPTYSIGDEHGYLSYGLSLARGSFYPDVVDVRVGRVMSQPATGHLAPVFAIGTSVLVAPVAEIDWRASFAVILGVHLLGTFFCAVALRRLGLSPIYASLYLLHPVAALYSRTVMSDIPTMTAMMAAVAAWVGTRRRPLLTGLALGLSVNFRFSQAVLVAAFGIAVLARDLVRSRREGALKLESSLRVALGLAPGLLLFLAVSLHLYGGFFLPPGARFALANIPDHLPRYLLTQNAFYPLGMLVAFFFPSRLRLECICVTLVALLLFGSFNHLYEGFGSLAQALIGDRFFLPVFSLIIIPYAGALDWIVNRWARWRRAMLSAGICGLMLTYVALSVVHQDRLRHQAEIQNTIYDSTAEDAIILFGSVTAGEYFFDGLGRRVPMPWYWLNSRHEKFKREYVEQVREAIPNVYVLSAERTDRDRLDARLRSNMLTAISMGFIYEPVVSAEIPPDRIEIYQITRTRRRR